MSSISLDFTMVWNQAIDILRSMWPIFVLPLGIVFGFGILAKIIKEVRSAVGSV